MIVVTAAWMFERTGHQDELCLKDAVADAEREAVLPSPRLVLPHHDPLNGERTGAGRPAMHRIIVSAIAGAVLTCTPLLAHAKCNDPPAPKVDWHDCDKKGANLEQANLSGAVLSNANLTDANLHYANLEGANLRSANLNNAFLQGARLGKADLGGAALWGADLRGANLQGADLRGAMLLYAHLEHASLERARLEGATLEFAALEGATWSDERKCAPGSIGTCKYAQTAASGPEAIMPTLNKEVPGVRIGWDYNVEPGIKAAQKDGKPIVVVFVRLGENWSKLFLIHVLRCPTFNTLAGQAHFLILEPFLLPEDSSALAKSLDIHEVPTLSIISIKGKSMNEIVRATGAADEAQVLQLARQAGLSPGTPGQANTAPPLGTIPPAGCLPTRHPGLRELPDARVTLPPQGSN